MISASSIVTVFSIATVFLPINVSTINTLATAFEDFFLLEDGESFILLEDDTSKLLLE